MTNSNPSIDPVAAYGLLCDSLSAWEDEEDSVQEEHADLIDQLRAFIEANAHAYRMLVSADE